PTRSAQLAANLSARVLVRVDVRIGQPGPDGRNGFCELPWGDSLAVGSDDVRHSDHTGHGGGCRRTGRLAAAAAEEEHDAAGHVALTEVHVRHVHDTFEGR